MENSDREKEELVVDGPTRENRIIVWLKRFGLAGFLFFLIKGLLWLLVPVLLAKGC
ncbi:MAG: hypothetical protein AAB401_25205 [Acidobacteriota bacterium]